ncbi:hypothetical protein ALI144C_20805 [Actinosynnema sp. ALI-1.44]|nr:hypothetical protein ALI144C_20805 [Actinosynnema sp. ALI-1.44]
MHNARRTPRHSRHVERGGSTIAATNTSDPHSTKKCPVPLVTPELCSLSDTKCSRPSTPVNRNTRIRTTDARACSFPATSKPSQVHYADHVNIASEK